MIEKLRVGADEFRDYWIFLIAALLIMISKGEVSALKTFFLLLVQFFFIYIPGKTFLRLTKIIFQNGAVANLCAYAVGYVMSIILYIFLLMISAQKYCVPVYLVYGGISLLLLYKGKLSKNYKRKIHNVDLAILLTCFVIALFIGVVVYLLPNRSAQVIGYQNQMGDMTYWFKNCVAATKGYPLPELSIKDLYLYWHLFSCFEVAFLHFMTGIEIYNLCFTFAYVWKIFLLVGGTYVLASYFLKKKSLLLIAMLVTLFTSGLDTQTLVFYQDHLYRCSLAFEEGYAMSMFGLVFFLNFMDMEKKNVSAYLLTAIGMAGALGLKVSGGTVLLAGIAGRVLFSLQKDWRKILKIGMLFGSYCLIYYVISKAFIIDGNALTSLTSSHRMFFSPTDTLMRSGHYELIYQTLRTGFLNKYVAYVITALIYLIQSNYAVSVPLAIGMFFMLISGRWRDLFSKNIFPLIIMILCGQGIFILFNHPGFSQVYFIFNTFSFAAVLAMTLWERCLYDFKYIGETATVTAVVFIILNCHYNFVNYTDIYYLSPDAFSTGIHAQSSGENDVSSLEMTGLRWIRDNLPEDVVIATNKVLLGDPEESRYSRTFITSEYSERQVYLEGFSSTNLPSMEFVMDRLSKLRNYYNGIPGSAEVLRQDGVTHAVVFKSGQDMAVLIEGKVVYENDDMVVLGLGESDG